MLEHSLIAFDFNASAQDQMGKPAIVNVLFGCNTIDEAIALSRSQLSDHTCVLLNLLELCSPDRPMEVKRPLVGQLKELAVEGSAAGACLLFGSSRRSPWL